MSKTIHSFRADLKQPWLQAFLLVALIPLLPEYISFFMAVPAMILAWKDMRQNNRTLRIGTIGKVLLLYIAYMFITTLYSDNFLHSLATVAMWAFFFLVYLLIYNLLTDSERCDSLLLCMTGIAGLVGLIACCQYRVGYFTESNPIEFWGWLDEIVFEYLPISLQSPQYVLRSCSTFNNPNILAEYLMTTAPFVAYFNFCEQRRGVRFFCRICLLFAICGVLFSFSRGGYIALIALCLALVLLTFRRRLAAISTFLISAFILVPDEVVKRLLSILPGIKVGGKVFDSLAATEGISGISGNTADSHLAPQLTQTPTTITTPAEIINNSAAESAINSRLRVWVECISEIGERPLFGYGAGIQNTWDMLYERGIYTVHAHNLILQTMMEGGLIALAIMGVLGWLVVRAGIRLLRNRHTRAFWIGFAVLMFVVAFFIQGLVDYPLLTPKLICNFVLILAISDRAQAIYIDKGLPLRKNIARTPKKEEKQAD